MFFTVYVERYEWSLLIVLNYINYYFFIKYFIVDMQDLVGDVLQY